MILRHVLFVAGITSVFFVLVFVLQPIPALSEAEALVEEGIVIGIYESGDQDITLQLADNDRLFYINRGLEKGLDLNTLKHQLIGQTATLKYPSYWTPLDWNSRYRHLSKLESEGVVLYNELE